MTAIIYYSLSGHTKREVESRFEGDFYRLKGKIKIPKNYALQLAYLGFFATFKIDLNYETLNIDFDKYDTVVLASPVWAFTIAPFLKKFLKERKFEHKKVVTLITHEGGEGKALKHFRRYIKHNNEIVEEYSIKLGGKYEKHDK